MGRILDEVVAAAPNRRRFMSKIAMATAGVAAVGSGALNAQSAAPTDADILNFALNLEYLEAEFYTIATMGKTIDAMGIGITGTGQQGTTTGGKMIDLTNPSFLSNDIANQIGADERAHVTLIRTALTNAGAQPVAKPAIKLDALGIGFGSLAEFLTLARAFEDVGVTAYAGAAPLITDKTILGYAARIAEVEAEHASNIRLQVATLKVPTMLLDGVDVLPPPSGQKYFSVDNMGLTQVRTPGQVLYIVYGNQANVSAGGFFPAGVNGNIKTSTAGISIANVTNAVVTPSSLTTTSASVVLDASQSTSGAGNLQYFYQVVILPPSSTLPKGSLQPAVLQTANNPKATIDFVNGFGLYVVQLTVTDASGMTAKSQLIMLNYVAS